VVHSTSSYTLRGSRPFVINDTTLTASQTTYSGTITSFTDATGAPGVFPAALNQPPNEMGCLAGLVENMNGVCVEPSAVGCSAGTLTLGAASFTAGNEVEIVGNGISQIWSRPVTAEGCQKTSYGGDDSIDNTADCRNNLGYNGEMFGGCAAMIYAANLCPPPWRLPTPNDFTELLIALGAVSTPIIDDREFVEDKLISEWEGEYNGVIINAQQAWLEQAGNYYANKDRGDCIIAEQYVSPCTMRLLLQSDYGASELNPWYVNVATNYRHHAISIRCIKNVRE
jgi:hypothetical protein